MKKIIFTDIAIMRPILIMCIVIGHAFTIYTNSTYWSLPVGCQSNLLLSWINPTLISFALQTFVFISGYLFAYKSQEKIYRKSFVLSKFRRLYLPSILFSIVYILILHPDRFKSWDVLYEIFSGAGHLWFLPMLFWCYVLGAFLPRIDRTKILGSSLILLLVSYMSFLIPNFLRLANALHYFIYFFIGIYTFHFKDTIMLYVSTRKAIIPCAWFAIAIFCVLNLVLQNPQYNSLIYTLIKVSVNIVLGIIGSLCLFLTINLLLIKNTFLHKINSSNDIWFGMYIYHQFILVYIYYRTSIPVYLGNFSPFVALLITIPSSLLLVRLTLKTNIGRWLIG